MGTEIGFYLGKFTILHRGHQHVIDLALRETDKLIILIYDSPTCTDIPLSVRADWIRAIYAKKNIEVIEGWNSPEDQGYTDEITRIQNEYILEMVGEKGITKFYNAEAYGDHVSEALHCENCHKDKVMTIKDGNGQDQPLGAHYIQTDAYLYREFIHPTVYKDLITKVVFLGAESTGKSTIAEKLALEYNTQWMPEYGREYWFANQVDGKLTPEQLAEIAKTHVRQESSLIHDSNTYLFVDTNALTTYIFSLNYHGYANEELQTLADRCARAYDLVFLCDTDIPYDATWDRGSREHQLRTQRRIKCDLITRKIPFMELSGSLQTRIDKVKNILSSFSKWKNHFVEQSVN
ncbi:MAG: AAA family ATPase [Desulfovibrio sp.]|nr:AAA family ATPase [Desulfovibrio sp.]